MKHTSSEAGLKVPKSVIFSYKVNEVLSIYFLFKRKYYLLLNIAELF